MKSLPQRMVPEYAVFSMRLPTISERFFAQHDALQFAAWVCNQCGSAIVTRRGRILTRLSGTSPHPWNPVFKHACGRPRAGEVAP